MTKRKYDYILRTCEADLTSYVGFQWPEKGLVEAPDWDPTPECGGGLHGFLNGAGCGGLADWFPNAKWLVVRIPEGEYVDLDGEKVKFPRGEVVFCGSQFDATNFIARFVPEGTAIIGRTFEGENALVGDRGTASAGYSGKATAGIDGTATAGDEGTATAGDWGTATAGDWGTAIAGIDGTASAGYEGTATTCDYGTASAGKYGTVSAGEEGIIEIEYYDDKKGRIRKKTGYIGEDGLRPGVKYKLDEDHKFVEA